MLIFKAYWRAAAFVSCAMFLSFPLAPGVKVQAVSAAHAAPNATQEVKPRGVWSPTVTYALDDLVTLRGSSWRSKHANNKGKLPGSTSPSTAADWEAFAVGFNPLGAWTSTRRYEINDLVTRLGATWRSKNTNLNKPPESNAVNWQLFVARGAIGLKGATGPRGPQGPAGPSAVANGSASAPSFRFTSSPDTGIFSPGGGKIAMVENGELFLHDLGTENIALGSGALESNTGSNNTAVGSNALPANTAGFANTALGAGTLIFNTTGSNNTAVGSQALGFNAGGDNTAVGQAALVNNSGDGNTAVGKSALVLNAASGNTAVGSFALELNTTATGNTAVGSNALQNNTVSNNTAMGTNSLQANTLGSGNTAMGVGALQNNTTASSNTAVGSNALLFNDTGGGNTAMGAGALQSNDADSNTAVGAGALFTNSAGVSNTAVGETALEDNTSGGTNTAVGQKALANNTTGSNNTAVGASALVNNTSGSNNVALGPSAGFFASGSSNSVFIANTGVSDDTDTIKIGETQTKAFIAGISGVTVANSAAVLIDTSTGQLGTIVSSRRYKEDIRLMGAMSEMLSELRPVTFRYIKSYADGSKPIEYGLIAEEVAEVFPYLAVFNGDGQPETVKYHLLPTFLLAGYQEQQRVIAAQAERIASLEERLAAIEGMLARPTISRASNRR